MVYDPEEEEEAGKKKVKELALLAANCRGATLAQMRAIGDLIRDAPPAFQSFSGNWIDIDGARMLETQRAKRLSASALSHEVLAMRLFVLASKIAPIRGSLRLGDLPQQLLQHQHLIIPHNPWQTYLNLSTVVSLNPWEQTLDVLPRVDIQDVELPDEPVEHADEEGDPDRRQLLYDLLQEIQARITEVSTQDRTELSALNTTLSTIASQMQAVETVTGRQGKALQARVEKLARAVNILLWLVGALLLFILFKMQ